MLRTEDTDLLNGSKNKTPISIYIYFLQETHLRPRDICSLKVIGCKKIFHAHGNQKKAGIAILKSDKIGFEIQTIRKDKGNTT